MSSARSMLFATAALLAMSGIVFSADAAKTGKKERDPTFDACDVSTDASNITQFGNGLVWQQSNDKNDYVAPGLGACGFNYTDQTNLVCLKPGWVNSAHVNKCNAWVQVYLPETGVVTQGRVGDACGALENTTFGCNDIYVSKQMFEQLAGNQRESALKDGHLPGRLQWRFTTEPCWGCAAGLPGIYPNGTVDDCKGMDSMGFTRCGRRSGGERIVGASADFICNQNVDTCDKVEDLAKNLPKYKGKSASHAKGTHATGTSDSTKATSGPGNTQRRKRSMHFGAQ